VTTRFREELKKEEVLEGIQIYRVNCYNRFLFSFFSLPVILRHAKNYDVIHTTSYNAALPAWLAARIRRKPVLITFHEVWGQLWWQLPFASFPSRLAFYTWEQLLLKLSFNRFIGVSEFTRKALIDSGISKENTQRIYNGMDYKDFEGYQHQPPERFTFTYFGRLGISKGLDLLIPAMKSHLADYPESRLKLIIPTYPRSMFKRIVRLIEEHGIGAQVDFMHNLPRKKLFDEICHSSCVTVPSYSEGFCFVAAEVVALGVPIISSQRGALKEVVGGKMIAMRAQTVEALAEAMNRAREGDWLVKEVPAYQLEDSVQQYINLYEDENE
jgi:glycosyltransferase involved in cell wall biosynthesis